MQRRPAFNGRPLPLKPIVNLRKVKPAYRSSHGALFSGDCLQVLPAIKDECVDTIFADPPFNIGKEYGRAVNDNREQQEYIDWCNEWIHECARVLKKGGAFFLYNIPMWNVILANSLTDAGLHFRHWIAVDIKLGLPIAGRLYPSHYSLLYFTKGDHKTFRNIRTPIQTCRHCDGDIKDYGGHRSSMNPNGVNLTDVWSDISPVRHRKFKSSKRKANALSTKLLDRVVELTTEPGEMVLDPFGGSGTTYAVCERKDRCWLGVEIEKKAVKAIIDRIQSDDLAWHKSDDCVCV